MRLKRDEKKSSLNWREDQKLDDFVRPAEGMLSFYGYHVGSTLGRSEDFRREVLSKIFHEKNLPLVGSLSYVEEWGASSSKKRLNKINNCLLGFFKFKISWLHGYDQQSISGMACRFKMD